jgi:AbrB family looped-hinge helix DNA binding protein
MSLKISQKGWVVIPADLRRKYDLKPGDRITVVDYGGVLSLIPASADPLGTAAGMLKGEASLTQSLISDRKKERVRGR